MVFSGKGRPGGRSLLMLAVALLSLVCAKPAFALNCFEYVRNVSGMDVSGDGWQWWSNSGGRYEHGHKPKPGAIMVFDRTPSMEHGHVAIVARVLDDRTVTVNHANWTHHHSLKAHADTGVMVQDVSDKNDWSDVRVMDLSSGSYGRDNPILGFVYNQPGHAPTEDNSLVAQNAPAKGADHGAIKDIDNE